jgi:hypothetical protein
MNPCYDTYIVGMLVGAGIMAVGCLAAVIFHHYLTNKSESE